MKRQPTLTGLDVFASVPNGFNLLTYEECNALGISIKYDSAKRERMLKYLEYDEIVLGRYRIISGCEIDFWTEVETIQNEIINNHVLNYLPPNC